MPPNSKLVSACWAAQESVYPIGPGRDPALLSGICEMHSECCGHPRVPPYGTDTDVLMQVLWRPPSLFGPGARGV